MTLLADTSGNPGNTSSPSWLKQRTSIFNKTPSTDESTKPKVVDKELARLKNIGAVSSVWSNKFVQNDSSNLGGKIPLQSSPKAINRSRTFSNEDNSGTTTTTKKPVDEIASALQSIQQQQIPPQPQPQQGSQRINLEHYPNDLLDTPVSSPSSSATSSTYASPTLGFQSRNSSMSTLDLKDEERTEETINSPSSTFESGVKKADEEQEEEGVFSAPPLHFLKQATASTNNTNADNQKKKQRKSLREEAASLWFQCETLKTEIAQTKSRLQKANDNVDFYKRQLESKTNKPDIEKAKDEAAGLWFQCETLKTEVAQTNARLKKATEDIDFYKRQLEQKSEMAEKHQQQHQQLQKEASSSTDASADHKDLDEAAALWFQCEALKTENAQTNARLKKAMDDIDFYKRQLETKKEVMEQKQQEQPKHNMDEAAGLWFQCETLKTEVAQMGARLKKAYEDVDFYKRQLEAAKDSVAAPSVAVQDRSISGDDVVSKDEAAQLWFQNETLKTQMAKMEARYKRSVEEVEFYKRQLEQKSETTQNVQPQQREIASNAMTSTLGDDVVSKDEAAKLWFQNESLKTEVAKTNARLKRAKEDIDFYKRQLEIKKEVMEQKQQEQSKHNMDEAAGLWFQCETLKTEVARLAARLKKSKEDAEFYKRQMEMKVDTTAAPQYQQAIQQREMGGDAVDAVKTQSNTAAPVDLDEAAKLWFQCETLKTQIAQTEARLKKANENAAFYKRQLDSKSSTAAPDLDRSVHQEKEKEIQQLTEIIFKQEQLLNEYESRLSSLADGGDDVKAIGQEMLTLRKQNQNLEDAITALRGELEMSHNQMRLMMAVSTEIQDEFDAYKEQVENHLNLKSDQKQDNNESASLDELKEALAVRDSAVSELQQQVAALNDTIQKKDKALTHMDAQIMELTQTILEKDALLMEHNSSNERHHQQAGSVRAIDTTSIPTYSDNDTFYSPRGNQSSSTLNSLSQSLQYSYSSSDGGDEDESEVLAIDLSDDDLDNLHHNSHYHQILDHDDASSDLQSPSDTATSSISSTISFDSSDEEEKIAELKHFSYNSTHSQHTEPVSLINDEALPSGQELMEDVNRRLSSNPHNSAAGAVARFSMTNKEPTGASWSLPPPTPPPTEPLPPIPTGENTLANTTTIPTTKTTLPSLATPAATPAVEKDYFITAPQSHGRRPRSGTLGLSPQQQQVLTSQSEFNLTLPGKSNNTLQQQEEDKGPIPPPRRNVNRNSLVQQSHTSWMDDPESDDEDVWCDTTSKPTDWNAVAAL